MKKLILILMLLPVFVYGQKERKFVEGIMLPSGNIIHSDSSYIVGRGVTIGDGYGNGTTLHEGKLEIDTVASSDKLVFFGSEATIQGYTGSFSTDTTNAAILLYGSGETNDRDYGIVEYELGNVFEPTLKPINDDCIAIVSSCSKWVVQCSNKMIAISTYYGEVGSYICYDVSKDIKICYITGLHVIVETTDGDKYKWNDTSKSWKYLPKEKRHKKRYLPEGNASIKIN